MSGYNRRQDYDVYCAECGWVQLWATDRELRQKLAVEMLVLASEHAFNKRKVLVDQRRREQIEELVKLRREADGHAVAETDGALSLLEK
jgi:hypothetical protein